MAHWYHGRKDDFIRRALATGKYRVETDARVINCDVRGTGAVGELKRRMDHCGYTVVHLFDGNRRQPVLLHRVVALAHLPPPDSEQTQINHKDGNKANCVVGNLEWVTAAENCRHAYETGLRESTVPDDRKFKKGSHHHFARLREANVIRIRELLRSGRSQQCIAAQFGVSQPTISRIGTGRIWTHLESVP